MFNKTKNTGDEAPKASANLSPKEQEERDEKLEKDAKAAAAKANKNPVDAHGNPMPDLRGVEQKYEA